METEGETNADRAVAVGHEARKASDNQVGDLRRQWAAAVKAARVIDDVGRLITKHADRIEEFAKRRALEQVHDNVANLRGYRGGSHAAPDACRPSRLRERQSRCRRPPMKAG